jgi:hypothetical protein
VVAAEARYQGSLPTGPVTMSSKVVSLVVVSNTHGSRPLTPSSAVNTTRSPRAT